MARSVTLTVEDGSVVSGANSFVTEDQVVKYAASRGVTLANSNDADLDAVAVLAIKAADYLQVQPWKGRPVSVMQTMPFPRDGLDTTPTFPNNAVPLAVIEAQLQLALFANDGIILLPASMGSGTLIKEKIGPIENVYSEKIGLSADGLPLLPGILMLLDPWLLGNMDGILPVAIYSVGGGRSYGC